MATVSPVDTRREIDAEREDLKTHHFLTLREIALMLSLGAAAWAAVLSPFLF
jgi:hypothetical protein